MKRAIALGALIGAGGLSLAAAGYQAPAQAPARVITVDKVKDNLFVLKGGGGNTAVFVTTTGVVLVDTKNPGWGQPILDKVKELTPKPVTLLINTHAHGDHSSGNVEFPATVDVVAQANTKTNMEKLDIFKKSTGLGMAKRTFTDRMTLGSGADQIDLHYFGPGHTNGDAWVVFPALRTVHAGDMFPSKGLPLVDAANGGSVLRYPESLAKASSALTNIDTVINGHAMATMTAADLKTYSEFMRDFVTWAQAELKTGKTPEEIAGGFKVPEKYPGYSGTVAALFGGLPGEIRLLSEEMKK